MSRIQSARQIWLHGKVYYNQEEGAWFVKKTKENPSEPNYRVSKERGNTKCVYFCPCKFHRSNGKACKHMISVVLLENNGKLGSYFPTDPFDSVELDSDEEFKAENEARVQDSQDTEEDYSLEERPRFLVRPKRSPLIYLQQPAADTTTDNHDSRQSEGQVPVDDTPVEHLSETDDDDARSDASLDNNTLCDLDSFEPELAANSEWNPNPKRGGRPGNVEALMPWRRKRQSKKGRSNEDSLIYTSDDSDTSSESDVTENVESSTPSFLLSQPSTSTEIVALSEPGRQNVNIAASSASPLPFIQYVSDISESPSLLSQLNEPSEPVNIRPNNKKKRKPNTVPTFRAPRGSKKAQKATKMN